MGFIESSALILALKLLLLLGAHTDQNLVDIFYGTSIQILLSGQVHRSSQDSAFLLRIADRLSLSPLDLEDPFGDSDSFIDELYDALVDLFDITPVFI